MELNGWTGNAGSKLTDGPNERKQNQIVFIAFTPRIYRIPRHYISPDILGYDIIIDIDCFAVKWSIFEDMDTTEMCALLISRHPLYFSSVSLNFFSLSISFDLCHYCSSVSSVAAGFSVSCLHMHRMHTQTHTRNGYGNGFWPKASKTNNRKTTRNRATQEKHGVTNGFVGRFTINACYTCMNANFNYYWPANI